MYLKTVIKNDIFFSKQIKKLHYIILIFHVFQKYCRFCYLLFVLGDNIIIILSEMTCNLCRDIKFSNVPAQSKELLAPYFPRISSSSLPFVLLLHGTHKYSCFVDDGCFLENLNLEPTSLTPTSSSILDHTNCRSLL